MRRKLALFALPVVLLAACTQAPSSENASAPTSNTSSAASGTSSSAASVSPTPTPTPVKSTVAVGKPVHVSLLESDDATYGVGMPIIAWFNVRPTSGVAFAKATTVTVNGAAVKGAWYFEPTAHAGAALEGHFRTAAYWPGHAKIELNLPVKGLSAGKGLVFDDSLTLSMSTGAANISTVNAATLKMTVTSDGRTTGIYPVSLGAADTRTLRGTKVIMEKGLDISMRGPGYFDAHVKFTQRLTYDGEYLHSAPWNVRNLGVRSTSNGCTNLSPAVAQGLYTQFNVGDVVLYPNASGPTMTLGEGYGDWNMSWSAWQTGGALQTA